MNNIATFVIWGRRRFDPSLSTSLLPVLLASTAPGATPYWYLVIFVKLTNPSLETK